MRIQPVFISEKIFRTLSVAGFRIVVQRADIAAGTKCPLSRALQQHQPYCRILRPTGQNLVDRADHLVIQRIQRLRPVQRDSPHAGVRRKQHIAGGFAHFPALMLRAMITRMISLVPSRI